MESLGSQTENREEQMEKIIRFIERAHVYEFFENLREGKNKTPVPFEVFKDFLVRMNGIVRDIPILERKVDGANVLLEGFVEQALVPRAEDKEPLLHGAYDSVAHVKVQGDEAYLLPAVVNAVHLFADGNGRSSRLLNILLRPHSSKQAMEQELQIALSEDGRFDSLDINPSILAIKIEHILLKRHGVPAKDLPGGLTRVRTNERVVGEKAREYAKKFDVDTEYCFLALYEYLTTRGLLEQAVSGKADFPNLELEDGYKAISLRKVEEMLTDKDWEDVFGRYYALKKEHVEILIDIFVRPDDYPTNEGSKTLRDYFVETVQERYENNKVI